MAVRAGSGRHEILAQELYSHTVNKSATKLWRPEPASPNAIDRQILCLITMYIAKNALWPGPQATGHCHHLGILA